MVDANGFKVIYSRGTVILWKAPDSKFEMLDSAFRQLGLMKKCVLSSVNFLKTKIEYFVGGRMAPMKIEERCRGITQQVARMRELSAYETKCAAKLSYKFRSRIDTRIYIFWQRGWKLKI